MARVLYLSYTGLLDPLGQSQVLQYLLALARDHEITLLTFEKPALARDTARLDALAGQCVAAGIDWRRLPYHHRPGLPATLYDVAQGARVAARLAREKRVQVIHTRSYVAGLMGMLVKRRAGARQVFDMRGFWPDERVDGGIWRREGLPYRLAKRLERALFTSADHVVSLTRAGVREFSAFDYLAGRVPPVSVIPTCTNLDLFRPLDAPRAGFTLGYVGSAGSWYMFDDVARAVAILFEKRPDSRFLVLNKGGHAAIRAQLQVAGVDMARVELREAPYDEVGAQIARMDAGLFFIRPAWSKRASCPTRMGEFLACGKPVLGNDGVGDVREIIAETGTGVCLPVSPEGEIPADALPGAIDRLLAMAAEPGMAARCRAAAEAHVSLAGGVAEYDRIYRRLAGEDAA